MSYTTKEWGSLPPRERRVHKVCSRCRRYFWTKIWLRHQVACKGRGAANAILKKLKEAT